jgi:hypothetical protein
MAMMTAAADALIAMMCSQTIRETTDVKRGIRIRRP